jgi:hypothetical protein
MSRAVAFIIVLLVGACASVGAVKPDKIGSVRTIGIVSAIGDRLQVRRVRFSGIDEDEKSFPIDGWGMDEYITGKVRAHLTPHFDVRAITYQRAAFAAPISNSAIAQLRSAASPQGLDAYLLITKRVSPFGSTRSYVNGLGIGNGAFGDYYAYALYSLTVVDGRHLTVIEDETVIKRVSAAPFQDHLYAFVHGPHLKVDASLWPTVLDQTQNGTLKAALKDLIDQSLPATLGKLLALGQT